MDSRIGKLAICTSYNIHDWLAYGVVYRESISCDPHIICCLSLKDMRRFYVLTNEIYKEEEHFFKWLYGHLK